MRQSVREHWIAFNQRLEGRFPHMYLDVRGYVTTGIGNKSDATTASLSAPTDPERSASHDLAQQLAWMTDDGRPAADDQIDSEWNLVKSRMDLAPQGARSFRPLTSLRLTNDEIDRIVFEKVDEMERHLKIRPEFHDFENWPADAELWLLSMAWAIGPAFNIPHFQSRVAAGNWDQAAAECRIQPNIGTIALRNDRDQQLFRNAAQVVATISIRTYSSFRKCDGLSRDPSNPICRGSAMRSTALTPNRLMCRPSPVSPMSEEVQVHRRLCTRPVVLPSSIIPLCEDDHAKDTT